MQSNFFFGSNTAAGFAGAYEHVVNADKLIILKGGAGTGKSTIIKKVAAEALQSGYQTEVYHCSSDVDSLDAVYIPQLKSAVVDGTAPHAIEASLPALKHFVFNLTDNTDYRKIKPHSLLVENCVKHKKIYFNNVYAHLKCANILKRNLNEYVNTFIDSKKIKKVIDNVFARIDGQNDNYSSNKFLSAITNKGIISYFQENDYPNVIALISNYDCVISLVLEGLKNRLLSNMINHTIYLSPDNATQIEGIKVGEYIVISSQSTLRNAENIDCDCVLNAFNRNAFDDQLSLINTHIASAIENINYARLTHIEIEKIYYPAMDWADINNKTKKIIDLFFN